MDVGKSVFFQDGFGFFGDASSFEVVEVAVVQEVAMDVFSQLFIEIQSKDGMAALTFNGMYHIRQIMDQQVPLFIAVITDGFPGITAPAFPQGRASLFEAVVDERECFVLVKTRDVVEEIDRTIIIIESIKDGYGKAQGPKCPECHLLVQGKEDAADVFCRKVIVIGQVQRNVIQFF